MAVDAKRTVRDKWRLLKPTMDERAQRLWAGAQAGAMGYGGVAAVARATKLAISTVRKAAMRSGREPKPATWSEFGATVASARSRRRTQIQPEPPHENLPQPLASATEARTHCDALDRVPLGDGST